MEIKVRLSFLSLSHTAMFIFSPLECNLQHINIWIYT